MSARPKRKKRDLKKLLERVESRKFPKLNPNQKLSLCVIAKNEERFIGQCLKSVEDVVDEIIVVDTGSDDRTVEIAKEHGAKVYYREWDDDFSAARNYSIDKATGDWILILDCDEILSEESREQIRAFLVDIGTDVYYQLRIKNYSLKDELINENYMIRFFKNTPETRYTGKIHEQIYPKKGNGFINISSDSVHIIHYGYSKEIMKEKNKTEGRNIPILESIINDNDQNYRDSYKGFINYYLAGSSIELGKKEDAIEYFEKSIELARKDKPTFLRLCYLNLMNVLFLSGQIEKLNEVLLDSEDTFEDQINKTFEYWYYKAAYEHYIKNYETSLEYIDNCHSMYNSKEITFFRLSTFNEVYFFSLLLKSSNYLALEKLEDSLEVLEDAFEQAKEKYSNSIYLFVIAKSLAGLGEYKTSSEIIEYILDNELSDEVKLYTYLSNLYLKQSKFSEAIRLQAKVHKPENVKESWYAIIKSLEDEKFFPAAEECYSVIIDLMPNEIQAYLGRAVSRLIQDKSVDAFQDLALAKKQASNNEDLIKVGRLYIQVGQALQAQACFDEVLENDPVNLEANLSYAALEQAEGSFETAVSRLERIIDLYPDDEDLLVQYGNLLLSLQDIENVDKSIEIFEKAKKINPDNAYIHYAIGIAFLTKDNKDQALISLQETLRLEPNNEEIAQMCESLKAS